MQLGPTWALLAVLALAPEAMAAATAVPGSGGEPRGASGPIVLAADNDSGFCKLFPKWCGKESVPGGSQNMDEKSGGAARAPATEEPGTRGMRPPAAPAPASPPVTTSPPPPPPTPPVAPQSR